ncbi:cobalt ECF transporter T component CbiQ [Pelosinus sp. sgz500959]|uniref:cobalt ECF transporter T component CbiQ n=1 Tax=Pelosinus sp. sgz500959 TaxID=3242472 RepID=UPI00366D3DE9
MSKIESYWLDLKQLDEMASKATMIHLINPCVKLLTTVIFLIVVASFSKYEISGLFPMMIYPMIVIILGELPINPILNRVLLALPFVLFIGIFNPIFDRIPLVYVGPFFISGGWVSFISILLRFILAVTAALVLVATTGIDAIGMALLRLKVPKVLVVQLLFMYRYLYVLLEEFIRTLRAYSLRSFHGEGIQYGIWGSLLGQLLLRTIDRAQRIYQAMLCRGFDGEVRLRGQKKLVGMDVIYLLGWSAVFIILRLVNISQWLGTLLVGGY